MKLLLQQLFPLFSSDEGRTLFTRATWKVLLAGAVASLTLIVSAVASIDFTSDGACGTVGCGVRSPLYPITDTAGYELVQRNCASCHHIVKDATGPALRPALRLRDHQFLARFLKAPRDWPGDSLAKRYKATYLVSCVAFPQLDSVAIMHIANYIREERRQ